MPLRFLCIAILSVSIAHAVAPAKPFPQHTTYASGSILPSASQTARDSAAANFYDAWKAKYLKPGCEAGQAYVAVNLDHEADNKKTLTFSEAHGYGMLLVALMAGHDPDAQTLFNELDAYFHAHPDSIDPPLMAWRQVKGCKTEPDDRDSATDGDLDIACALLMADAQWGSAGAVNYKAEALEVIAAIKRSEVDAVVPSVQLGDWVTDAPKRQHDWRLSDFMPDHFRAFSTAASDAMWSQMVDAGYAALDWLQVHHAPKTGLVPDFARQMQTGQPVPAPAHFLESKFDGDYSYNACRVPFRIGVDFLLHGDSRAKTVLERLNTFIIAKTGGNPAKLKAGYELVNGQPIHKGDRSFAFNAPFAIAAMTDASHQAWLDTLWNDLTAAPLDDDRGDYYGNTLKALCLIALSGNWWGP